MQAADTPQMTRFTDLDDIWMSAASPQDIPVAIRQITALLRERHHIRPGALDDFRIRDLTEISQALASTSRVMTNLLLIVALISLVVGGVGIMNIMLVSVTERTREIGLRMAVGARSRDILRQFLVEAVVLCLAGGIAGILLGRGVSARRHRAAALADHCRRCPPSSPPWPCRSVWESSSASIPRGKPRGSTRLRRCGMSSADHAWFQEVPHYRDWRGSDDKIVAVHKPCNLAKSVTVEQGRPDHELVVDLLPGLRGILARGRCGDCRRQLAEREFTRTNPEVAAHFH